jgi:hypothetical protein
VETLICWSLSNENRSDRATKDAVCAACIFSPQ